MDGMGTCRRAGAGFIASTKRIFSEISLEKLLETSRKPPLWASRKAASKVSSKWYWDALSELLWLTQSDISLEHHPEASLKPSLEQSWESSLESSLKPSLESSLEPSLQQPLKHPLKHPLEHPSDTVIGPPKTKSVLGRLSAVCVAQIPSIITIASYKPSNLPRYTLTAEHLAVSLEDVGVSINKSFETLRWLQHI